MKGYINNSLTPDEWGILSKTLQKSRRRKIKDGGVNCKV